MGAEINARRSGTIRNTPNATANPANATSVVPIDHPSTAASATSQTPLAPNQAKSGARP